MDNTAEYNDIMANAADDAVKYVHKEYDYALDYSENSIEELEKSLEHIHRVLVLENDDPIDPKVVVTLSKWYGAYVGEVFRRHHGGDWGVDVRDPTAPAFQVECEGFGMSFPSVVFHRILGGEENNIADYYHSQLVELDIKRNRSKRALSQS